MPLDANITNIDGAGNIKVSLSNVPANVGSIRFFSENDPGLSTGAPYLQPPETDEDFRLRMSTDILLDEESFCYTAQNFTKHGLWATTFVPSFTATGFNTNPTGLTTASSNVLLKTYKTFSIQGTETLSLDLEAAFSAAMTANQVIEFGFGLTANTTPYDVFDGFYIRANSVGVYAVLRNNSSSDIVQSSAFKGVDGLPWFPVAARKYQFIIYLGTRSGEVWINDQVLGQIWLATEVVTPAGYGMPVGSPAQNFFVRQSYGVSAPSSAVSLQLSRCNVRRGGLNTPASLPEMNARCNENINSPGTLTTSLNQAITSGSITRPAAAVPSNTTPTLSSLGGIYVETGTLALATDAILMAFTNPALPTAVVTTYTQNKRLRIDGVSIASAVTAAFTAGGFSKFFYIAYGSGNSSLAGVTSDTVNTKAFRRVLLPIVQHYAATHAPGTTNNASQTYFKFANPIFVNPGEFVMLVTYHQGALAGVTGVITHALQFDYAFE